MTVFDIVQNYQSSFKPALTDAALAKIIGISHPAVSRIKNGLRIPNNKTMNLMWAKTPALYQALRDFYFNEQMNSTRGIDEKDRAKEAQENKAGEQKTGGRA